MLCAIYTRFELIIVGGKCLDEESRRVISLQ